MQCFLHNARRRMLVFVTLCGLRDLRMSIVRASNIQPIQNNQYCLIVPRQMLCSRCACYERNIGFCLVNSKSYISCVQIWVNNTFAPRIILNCGWFEKCSHVPKYWSCRSTIHCSVLWKTHFFIYFKTNNSHCMQNWPGRCKRLDPVIWFRFHSVHMLPYLRLVKIQSFSWCKITSQHNLENSLIIITLPTAYNRVRFPSFAFVLRRSA